MKKPNLINTAIRNGNALAWYQSCDNLFRRLIIETYAITLHCPVAEIDETFQQPRDIEWLSQTFGATITLWIEDNM